VLLECRAGDDGVFLQVLRVPRFAAMYGGTVGEYLSGSASTRFVADRGMVVQAGSPGSSDVVTGEKRLAECTGAESLSCHRASSESGPSRSARICVRSKILLLRKRFELILYSSPHARTEASRLRC